MKKMAKVLLIIGLVLNICNWYLIYINYLDCNETILGEWNVCFQTAANYYSFSSFLTENYLITIGIILIIVSIVLFLINTKYTNVYETKKIVKSKSNAKKHKIESQTTLLFFGLVAIIIAIIFVIFMAVK